MRALLAVSVVALGAGCGGARVRDGSPPPETRAASCRERPLTFAPRAGARYRFTAEERRTSDAEGTRRKRYESQLTFAGGNDGGWTVVEGGFAEPFAPWTRGDLTGAELSWKLDRVGLPVAPPEERWRGGEQDLLPNLSMFVFAPVGVVLPSTCPGDEGSSSWEQGGRRRAVQFRVVSADERTVSLHVESKAQTPVNLWRIEGELKVSRDDGLTCEGSFHVTGPGAPGMNDDQRTLRVRRD